MPLEQPTIGTETGKQDELDGSRHRSVHVSRGARPERTGYGEQIRSPFRSVMKPWPGAWVIINSGLANSAAFWGVTPHAQKTGIKSFGIRSTGEP